MRTKLHPVVTLTLVATLLSGCASAAIPQSLPATPIATATGHVVAASGARQHVTAQLTHPARTADPARAGHATKVGARGADLRSALVETTTGRFILFRGVSGHHQLGLFEPRIGCTPPPSGGPQTTAFQLTPAGGPLSIAATTLRVSPGTVRNLTLGCVHGQSLVDSWAATAFPQPVSPAFADAVHVERTIRGGQVSVKIVASETLPRAAHALVQIGVRCAT